MPGHNFGDQANASPIRDDLKLKFGSSSDVTVHWDGDNLIITAAADDSLIEIGDTATTQKSFDLKWYGNGASGADYLYFDASANLIYTTGVDIQFKDNDYAVFGTGAGAAGDVALTWNASYLQGGSEMWSLAPSPADANYKSACFEFFDDFLDDAEHAYTETDDGGTGSFTQTTDAAGGVATIATAGADNDYHSISLDNETFLFASGKKLWAEARIKLTEANTNESAWWFGVTNTLTTGGLQANAAGPLASYDGALIWKDEGTMEIDFETSNAATQNTDTNIGTFVSGTWITVGFYFDGTATTSTVQAYINGVAAGDAQDITLSGLEEMHLVIGVKAGPTGGAETLHVDYIRCLQLR